MIINKHELDSSTAWGNGGHGHCKHCRLALETDLGWCSWTGVKCIDREIIDEKDMPEEVRSYIRFSGYIWNSKKKIFIRPYHSDELTLDQLIKKINKIKAHGI